MINVPDDFAAKMLNDLAPREREVLGLIYLNDFDVADAAQLLAMKPDSVSAYLNRGRKKIGRMLNATAEEAGGLLSGLGQVRADRHRPVTLRSEMRGGLQTSVTIAPHRCVIGSAIREDEHLEMDLTRYFVTAIDGKVASAVEAEHWFRRRPMSFGLSIKREILVSKGIKAAEAFDRESLGYFFPVGFGCAELYFERNFEHKGDKVVAAVDQASRPVWLLDVWNLRLLDLGEYQKRYEDDLAAEIETVIRRRQP